MATRIRERGKPARGGQASLPLLFFASPSVASLKLTTNRSAPISSKKGYFWSERFKSVIVENGETLINCLAYIDLNPVRAGLVKRPEEYRWCSLGYHVQTRNKGRFLSLDFGLWEFGIKSAIERLRNFRRFVYEKGGLEGTEKGRRRDFEVGKVDRFLLRTRYFTDSGIIGSKGYVSSLYLAFKDHYAAKKEKIPKRIIGLEGVYSLKRLAEAHGV